jgi:membrane protein
MANTATSGLQSVAAAKRRFKEAQTKAQRLLVWKVWDRMLEIEFVDRSIALAGKAFVSFFPLVIVVAAFMPAHVRTSILTTLTSRLGIRGEALTTAREAFTSADDVRRATGYLGLILTIFFATSFTTALQRIYLRAWRRPPGSKGGAYKRGPLWLIAFLVYMAAVGGLRGLLGNGPGLVLFGLLSIALTSAWWWFTAWYLLLGEVRWRVLLPTGIITAVLLAGFAISATVWMPNVVTRNETQFGFFGVALALVTWFSGASTCVLIGACAGPVFAEDPGWVGNLIRGHEDGVLVDGAPPSLDAPNRQARLRDAFQAAEDV